MPCEPVVGVDDCDVADVAAALGDEHLEGERLRAAHGGRRPGGGTQGGVIEGARGLGGLLLVWLLVPILAAIPGVMSEMARNSSIARNIDRYGPDTPEALRDLRRQVTDFNFPEVFSRLGPSPSTGAIGLVLGSGMPLNWPSIAALEIRMGAAHTRPA